MTGTEQLQGLERRVAVLEAIVAQLLELPVVKHSSVVTARLTIISSQGDM